MISSLLVDTRNNQTGSLTERELFVMGRKAKYSAEQKIWAAETYLKGLKSASEIAQILNMGPWGSRQITEWSSQYRVNGSEIFNNKPRNNSYSLQFKEQVCQDYLSGKGSFRDLAARYGIPSKEMIRQWVKKYTGNKNELKEYDPQPEVYMATRKKTTLEERTRIVQWYFDNDCSYKKTAAEFGCSYTQVRDWVLKFKEQGENGLEDRRGKRKEDSELTAEEQMKREIARLKAMNHHLQMENELLKKAEEAERRWWMDTAESDKFS